MSNIPFQEIAPEEVKAYQKQVKDFVDYQREYDDNRLKTNTNGKWETVSQYDSARQIPFDKARKKSDESVETLKKIKEKMEMRGFGHGLSLKETQRQLEKQLDMWAKKRKGRPPSEASQGRARKRPKPSESTNNTP